jgi:hypothetical protein
MSKRKHKQESTKKLTNKKKKKRYENLKTVLLTDQQDKAILLNAISLSCSNQEKKIKNFCTSILSHVAANRLYATRRTKIGILNKTQTTNKRTVVFVVNHIFKTLTQTPDGEMKPWIFPEIVDPVNYTRFSTLVSKTRFAYLASKYGGLSIPHTRRVIFLLRMDKGNHQDATDETETSEIKQKRKKKTKKSKREPTQVNNLAWGILEERDLFHPEIESKHEEKHVSETHAFGSTDKTSFPCQRAVFDEGKLNINQSFFSTFSIPSGSPSHNFSKSMFVSPNELDSELRLIIHSFSSNWLERWLLFEDWWYFSFTHQTKKSFLLDVHKNPSTRTNNNYSHCILDEYKKRLKNQIDKKESLDNETLESIANTQVNERFDTSSLFGNHEMYFNETSQEEDEQVKTDSLNTQNVSAQKWLIDQLNDLRLSLPQPDLWFDPVYFLCNEEMGHSIIDLLNILRSLGAVSLPCIQCDYQETYSTSVSQKITKDLVIENHTCLTWTDLKNFHHRVLCKDIKKDTQHFSSLNGNHFNYFPVNVIVDRLATVVPNDITHSFSTFQWLRNINLEAVTLLGFEWKTKTYALIWNHLTRVFFCFEVNKNTHSPILDKYYFRERECTEPGIEDLECFSLQHFFSTVVAI